MARKDTVRAHLTQDKWGLWMVSLEMPNGKVHLDAYGIEDPEHDIGQFYNPDEIHLPANTEFLVSMENKPANWSDDMTKPRPKKVKAPYYVIKNGKKVKEVLK